MLTLQLNTVYHGDCLALMHNIPDASIDMILCDLPYGTTDCKWDSIIPFNELWTHYARVIKPNGAIVLTASQPFTSALVMSNPRMFKYEWIWRKNNCSNFQNAKKQPLKAHESVLVFYKTLPVYNPQGIIKLHEPKRRSNKGRLKAGKLNHIKGAAKRDYFYTEFTNYPKSILDVPTERGLHPTQKPVLLFEYLIKTYTNEGMTVLDNCAGSGTAAIAAINANRNYIMIEKDKSYYELIKDRIEKHEINLPPVNDQESRCAKGQATVPRPS